MKNFGESTEGWREAPDREEKFARQPFWLLSGWPEPRSHEGLGLGKRLGLCKFKVFIRLTAKRNRDQDETRDEESPGADECFRLLGQTHKAASALEPELTQREGLASQGLLLARGEPLLCSLTVSLCAPHPLPPGGGSQS